MQYGNLTRTETSEWSADGAWVKVGATQVAFHPYTLAHASDYTQSRYLVGLPASVRRYRCGGASCPVEDAYMLGSTLTIYDANPDDTQAPSEGKPAKIRTATRPHAGGEQSLLRGRIVSVRPVGQHPAHNRLSRRGNRRAVWPGTGPGE